MAGFEITKERKIILAVGGLLLLLGLVYRFYPDVAGLLPDGGELDVKMKTVERYRQKVAERRRIQERNMILTRRLEQAEQALLDGATPALAAVSIQNVINEIAQANGLEILSQLVLKTREEPEKDYLEIPVQITTRMNVAQLRTFLYRIESAPKLLAIVDMRLLRMEAAGPDVLTASMTVSGYMKRPEKKMKNQEIR
ncbi:MAG: type II secretion system protein GspM [Thermodesulfobacteriota bacterium]